MKTNDDVSGVLYIWSCLEQAQKKQNAYGGDTASVYVQHLIPSDSDVSNSKTWTNASKNLKEIVNQFCKLNNADAFVNGKPVGDWMDTFKLLDHCEVKIATRKKK